MSKILIPDPQKIIDLMRDVGASEIMPRFRALAPEDIREKGPNDPVTIADTESEKALTAGLKGLMPGSAIFGEEAFEEDPKIIECVKGDAPVWIIDPVDGTRNFTKGKDCFAIILALVQGGQTRAGFIFDPMTGATVWSIEGEGAYDVDGHRLPGPPVRNVEDMHGAGGFAMRKKLLVKHQLGAAKGLPRSMTSFGSTGREYMALAEGQLDFAFYSRRSIKPWDHAAGLLIVQETGFQATLAEDRKIYRPESILNGPSILVAPDGHSWQTLASTFRSFLA